MADVIRKSTNRFTKGLVMDFSPENTKNEVLTHALNATLLTFNGNELSLQNDMGNARVETAYLPEGYMPVGTCEYGGIIYIVSYNPLEDKSQIGCFPSPERNVSSSELGRPKESISRNSFQKPDAKTGELTGDIINTSTYVLLKNDNLNPGDKFLICTNPDIYNERLSDLWVEETGNFELISNPVIALNVVSIEDSGKIIYLNSDIKQYTIPIGDVNYKYHLLGTMGLDDSGNYEQATVDPDSYRNVLNSGYSVFKSKTSGKLAILAELVMIDSYSVTHSVIPKKLDGKDIVEGSFDIVVYPEVSPKVTYDNFNIVPKLQYYYLQNSQGYIQVKEPDDLNQTSGYMKLGNNWVKPYFKYIDDEITTHISESFMTTPLSEIYTPTTEANLPLTGTLNVTSEFNLPKPYTYHGRMQDFEGDAEQIGIKETFTKFTEGRYHRLNSSQVLDNLDYYTNEIKAKFYMYSNPENQDDPKYTLVPDDMNIDNTYEYFIKVNKAYYYDAERDTKYLNTALYKMITPPQVAPDSVLENASIEKYQSKITTTYKEATEEDKQNISKLLEKNGNSYSTVILQPGESLDPSKTYYVEEVTTVLESIGMGVIDRNEIKGDIYYYPATKEFIPATKEELEAYWDFETNPRDETDSLWGFKELFYWVEYKEDFIPATEEEKLNYKEEKIPLYYQADYIYIDPKSLLAFASASEKEHQLFITVPIDSYVSYEKFVPNVDWNFILGYEKPIGTNEPNKGFRDEGPIKLYTVADFIPNNLQDNSSSLQYQALKLGNIKIPGVASVNGLDFPFKYQYTLTPCMNYGRLDHLSVSNIVDFSKLHAFNQSNFTTWKYHIDGNQLRLTFGADIYDTYESDKVDGLILEFYDAWGFAGSLEITDKKAYSGVFTKIIPLNSSGALSKNKILGSTYITTFKRNINITEERLNGETTGNFLFNGKKVLFEGINQGWYYADNVSEDISNDCGTLYSNRIYGVKTYIRRTKYKGTENEFLDFIPKKEFFLYTLPIYNDYYYNVNDFSTLTNPNLDMLLTYKIQDSGTKKPYSNDDIINGYNKQDFANVSTYLEGNYNDNSYLELVKYYKYVGTSNLYLEVGLMKEYQDLGISYSSNLNNFFTCTLQLKGEDSESYPYSVQHIDSNVTSSEQALEYDRNSDAPLSLEINKLGFGTSPGLGFSNTLNTTIKDSNFIKNENPIPIPINYEFVVGYKININNIRSTEIPTTTVSALCHKTLNTAYNYEDFGIYELDGQFLSSAMFYNGGTADSELFGICKQVQTQSSTMIEQCISIDNIETPAQKSTRPRLLNTGEPLKQMINHIGKLTFCQPHAHGLSESNGVNIYPCVDGKLGISQPDVGTIKVPGMSNNINDDSHGVVPDEFLLYNPKYNLSLNTSNCIERYSEFISTLDYNVTSGKLKGYDSSGDGPGWTESNKDMLEYTGFSSEQIAIFNKKLIETMKGVYAYNPDYDSLSVMVGEVNVVDKQIKFVSNLLSTNAKFNFKEELFNDFIYIGNLSISNYLEYLNKHSEDNNGNRIEITYIEDQKEKILPQLEFKPGLTYCGDADSNYLITSLTYNTPSPIELEEELTFKSSNNIVVQHEDGSREFIQGVVNKKALYGFNDKLHKLIQLDVSNYIIENDGKLVLTSNIISGEASITKDLTSATLDGYGVYTFDVPCTFDNEEVNLKMNFITNIHSNVVKIKNNKAYVCILGSPVYGGSFQVNTSITVPSTKDYSYNVTINSVDYECSGKLLDPNKVAISGATGSFININQQSAETLQSLVSNGIQSVELKTSTGSTFTSTNISLWAVADDGGRVIQTNPGSVTPIYKFEPYGVNAVELYEVTFKKVNFTIKRVSAIENSENSIIETFKTSKYSDIIDSKYTVLSAYNNARFKGTSLTINDLEYDGTSNGHRLFVRNNICNNDGIKYRNIIYYRSLTDKDTWKFKDTQNKNHLFIQTGPCFTESNLEI